MRPSACTLSALSRRGLHRCGCTVKAMILAAGRGERMLPLTLHTPKPLLQVAGKPLLQYHLERLVHAGVTDIVINVSHLGEQIEEFFGDGQRYGAAIRYSREEQALETAGGIVRALPLLGDDSFIIVNADIWTDYPYEKIAATTLAGDDWAHLVLVDNPPQHHRGDFELRAGARVKLLAERSRETLTYAGIALYQRKFFADCSPGKAPLLPLLRDAMARGRVSGEHYRGRWYDVGTPERLAQLDQSLCAQ